MISTRYVVQLEANRDSDMFSYVEIDLLVHDMINVLFPILILGLITFREPHCLYASWHSFY